MEIKGCKISGICAAVPKASVSNLSLSETYKDVNIEAIVKNCGVLMRHVGDKETCSSDLCEAAANKLIEDIGWEKSSINALIFVSQTPDYRLPATACVLQHKLGLSQNCAAFDVNLGCSGYTYGLWLAACMISSGLQKVLLLAGDTPSKTVSHQDKSAIFLFGDAGSATLLESAENETMKFSFGTDGSGYSNLIIPSGGYRTMSSTKSLQSLVCNDGNVRNSEQLHMDGAEIFTFTLGAIPKMFAQLCNDISAIDYVVMHQANKFILQQAAKKIKIPKEKLVLGLEKRGNTSSASIPLAMIDELSETLKSSAKNLALAGFGVGYSWCGCVCRIGEICMPSVVLV